MQLEDMIVAERFTTNVASVRFLAGMGACVHL